MSDQRIGLIDVDGHNFPSLPLMKLSAWHKAQGDTVEWHDGFAPTYDRVYMCKVFSDEYSPDVFEPINAREIIKGGTGYAIKLVNGKEVYAPALDKPLPPEVEHIYPDYDLYPALTQNTAYGFLTRGCPRGCSFCHVAAKEGRCSLKVADLQEFWRSQKYIKLLDPNLLACRDHMALLGQLVDSEAWVDFTQGIDARLINASNAALLVKIKTQMMHFAMDSVEDIKAVSTGLHLYACALDNMGKKWRGRPPRVYILTNYNTTHIQDMLRVRAVQEAGYQPYIMIYNKSTAAKITRNLQRWANNLIIYKAQPCFDQYEPHRR